MAWTDLRDATHDVDSAARLDEEFRAAVGAVAARHDLAPRWINDSAAGFVPAGFDLEGAKVVLDHPRLWPRTSFETTAEAADAFHAAYPHEEPDHLGEWLGEIVRE